MNLDPKQDGQEQVVVELNSGRSYFVPREAVERLFLLCPDQAAALVARVSPLRTPLDPSGLPSEAGRCEVGPSLRNRVKTQKDRMIFGGGVEPRA